MPESGRGALPPVSACCLGDHSTSSPATACPLESPAVVLVRDDLTAWSVDMPRAACPSTLAAAPGTYRNAMPGPRPRVLTSLLWGGPGLGCLEGPRRLDVLRAAPGTGPGREAEAVHIFKSHEILFLPGKGLGRIYSGGLDRNPPQTSLGGKGSELSAWPPSRGHLAAASPRVRCLCFPSVRVPGGLLSRVSPRWRLLARGWHASSAAGLRGRSCSLHGVPRPRWGRHSVLTAQRCGAPGPRGGRGSGSSEQGALVGGGWARTGADTEGRAF